VIFFAFFFYLFSFCKNFSDPRLFYA
jgi:hypothetical protein